MNELGKAIFLSYASQDADAANRICEALRAAELEVWFDQSELRGGDSWDQKIRKQIKDCALFVPIISANTQSRAEGYFRLEWHLAEQRSHLIARGRPFIVPVAIDDTRDTDALVPDAFLAVQWIRLSGGVANTAFAETLRALLGGGRVGAALRRDPAQQSDHAESRHKAAPTRKPFLFAWLSGVALVVAAVAAFFIVRSPPRPASTASSKSAGSDAPLSEARQLVARAKAISDRGGLTRMQLDTVGELCDRALQLDPTDAIVWKQAAQADLLLIHPYGYDRSDERRKRAQFRAGRAIALAPESFEVRAMQAAVIAHAGGSPALLKEAESLFRELIAHHPGNRELIIQLAEVLREQDRFEEAAALFESIGEFEVAAWSYFQAGRGQAALFAVNRSLQERRAVTALQLKAILESKINQDLAAAQATIDQLQPSELLSEMQGAIAAEIALFRRDSERMLQIVKALPSDYLSSNAFKGPRQYFTGLAHELAGRAGAAESEWRAGLAVVQERLKSAPEERELLLWAAWLQAALGAKAEAERSLDRAQDVAGVDRGAIDRHSVRVFLRLGRNEEVLAWLPTVFRTKPMYWEDEHARARFDPRYQALRGDPRLEKLLRENLPEGAKPFEEQEVAAKATQPNDLTSAAAAGELSPIPAFPTSSR